MHNKCIYAEICGFTNAEKRKCNNKTGRMKAKTLEFMVKMYKKVPFIRNKCIIIHKSEFF